MKNYYNILGIRKNASHDEIRKAYRNLALKFHPDKDESHKFSEVIKDINEAKQVLLNEERKREYDSLFVEEGSGNFFSKFKKLPDRMKDMKRKPGQPEFIKQNTGKKIVLLSSLSILFAIALIFFFKIEENEPVPNLTIYKEINEANDNSSQVSKETFIADTGQIVNSISQKNSETAVAKTDKSINIPREEPLTITTVEPALPEIKNEKHEKIILKSKNSDSKEKTKKSLLPGTKPDKINDVPINNEKRSQRKFSNEDMGDILRSINLEKIKMNSKSNCVQIRKTVTSNVQNGFKLADYLRKHGFIISGRETVSGTVKRIKIDAANDCFKVTIGTY